MANVLGINSDDVAESYESTFGKDKVAWVERKIDEAVRELLGHIPDIPARIKTGQLDEKLVMDKVVAAVLRVVRNPLGIEAEGEGDYNIKLRPTVASGDIWYLEKDLVQLGWVAPLAQAMPRTVRARATAGWGFPS